MFEFRVTKYNPAYRDSAGAFTREEWIAVSDIGQAFDGVVLTKAEYQRVEDAYAASAVAFLREAGVPALTVTALQNHAAIPLSFADGSLLELAAVEAVIRQLLQEKFWCRLEGVDAFVHVGWDYYMYVGVPRLCPGAEALARQFGLFVERFESPYNE